MATYRVYQKKENSKGDAPIYISFYLNREKIEVGTKISIPPKHFDPVKGIVRSSFEYAKDKNLIISDIKAMINDILVRYRLAKKELTRDLFIKEFRNPEQSQDFFAFCKEYQKLRFQEIQESTQDKHRSCLANLREFKSAITFAELDEDLLRQFVLYLRRKKGVKEITINKNISVIKSYLNAAKKRGLIPENPASELKLCQCEDTTAPCITEEELEKLVELYRNHFFSGINYDALEFFLFMCFSSLHITDARELRIEQIGNNDFWYVRVKMLGIRPKVVRVPISDPLRKIINHHLKGRKEGQLWDELVTDQEINKRLKYIATVAGIKKKLSAKYGRHTFATIFLRKTKDINALKEIMGHTNIKQTYVYAHVLDQDKQDGVSAFNSFKM
ncbi:site-specific integrase [uncultured Parabacteroides sp.]|uniref:site-specific integrase n=1 Tax=uncultured Parabacteroides sp. TaxID=512312 RepID=UPI00259AFA8F|nr:site-specific integrase [uncultured Parabacteroides sp.]